jgi:hypothetical protein
MTLMLVVEQELGLGHGTSSCVVCQKESCELQKRVETSMRTGSSCQFHFSLIRYETRGTARAPTGASMKLGLVLVCCCMHWNFAVMASWHGMICWHDLCFVDNYLESAWQTGIFSDFYITTFFTTYKNVVENVVT